MIDNVMHTGYDVSGVSVQLGMRTVFEVREALVELGLPSLRSTELVLMIVIVKPAWNVLRLFYSASMLACAYKQAFVKMSSNILWGSMGPAVGNYLYPVDILYIDSSSPPDLVHSIIRTSLFYCPCVPRLPRP